MQGDCLHQKAVPLKKSRDGFSRYLLDLSWTTFGQLLDNFWTTFGHCPTTVTFKGFISSTPKMEHFVPFSTSCNFMQLHATSCNFQYLVFSTLFHGSIFWNNLDQLFTINIQCNSQFHAFKHRFFRLFQFFGFSRNLIDRNSILLASTR